MLPIAINSALSMSSIEIAELTGKEHKHVLRDIENMLKAIYKTDGPNLDHNAIQGVTYHLDNRGYTSKVELNKHHSMTLVTGYSVELRHRVNGRWLELEESQQVLQKPTARLIPARHATEIIKAALETASLFGIPPHYAQNEAVKYAHKETGFDYSNLLTYSPAQDNIKEEEVMLEPTELGKQYGMSAIALNRLLADHGYQKKGAIGWEPTELGRVYCVKHAWNNRAKSGYNMKWRKDLIVSLLSGDHA